MCGGIRAVLRERLRLLAGSVVAAGLLLLASCGSPSPEMAVADHWSVLDRYCIDCHNDAEFAGNLSFETVKPQEVAERPEVWEKVVRKLRGDLMPPPGGPRPDATTADAFVASLESFLDAAAASRGPQAGRVGLHRLNRTEYATVVEELLGIRIDARALLPGDLASEGFDNVAEVLGVTPTHLDQYIAAARDISLLAVGQPKPELTRADYRSKLENRTTHVDGLPLGTRGGLAVEHLFPADGEYELNLTVSSIPGSELRGYPYGWLDYRHELVVTIDGAPVFRGGIGGPEDQLALDQGQIQAVDAIRARFRNIRVNVSAGRRNVAAAFVARSFAAGDYLLETITPGEGVPDIPRLFGFEIIGPYNPTGIRESTESRERVFVCYPTSAEDERPCARDILTNLARRAFRRPLTAADLDPLLAFYDAGYAVGGFETGVQKGLMAILASTKFLFRAEPGEPPAGLEPGAEYAISDLELAWRLSFFLWSQGPDDELLGLVEAGRLSDADIFEQQVRRMLADSRSESLVTNFAYQWLGVRRLDAIDPDPRLYPNFDEDLRRAFREEMRLFLDSILRADRSVVDLLTASHTFVNERLARHYGLDDIRGDQFRRIELEDATRWGLFGKGNVLMVTSYPDRTSPVLRGAWIMEHILAAPPTAPPPEVETDLAPVAGDVPRSVRERLALHRTEASCNQCHGVIDPLGQALENFNAIGEWRTEERDSGVAIDSSGRLAGGGEVNGPADMRAALVAQPEHFAQTVTEKLMIYALGRGLEYYDMPTVRAIVEDAAHDDFSFAAIVMGIAKSVPFRMRSAPEAEDAATRTAAVATITAPPRATQE
jgi:hypothetical protein